MTVLDRVHDASLGKGMLELVRKAALRARESLGRPLLLMEVCGTHTMAIARSGLRELLSGLVELRSGPGCPVCVTAQGDIDSMIDLALRSGITVATFGDMIRVPGKRDSLERARAAGAAVRVVYSPVEAVELAGRNSGQVVFLGVGFETTAPAVALSVEMAARKNLKNYSVFPAHKLVPPVMKALLTTTELKLDGLLLPGHVAAITGRRAFEFVGRDFGLNAVVTGFETLDILDGLYTLVNLILSGRTAVENSYRRVVRENGNQRALSLLDQYFAVEDADWRGFGRVDSSGLGLAKPFRDYDARVRFGLGKPRSETSPGGCRCGDLLQGLITPQECPLFARSCRPEQPVGPCMVSSEGACSAWYRYGRKHKKEQKAAADQFWSTD